MGRRARYVHGIPIEEAPFWVLAILSALLFLVLFPATVGLLDGAGWLQGDLSKAAVGAAFVDVVLVVGLVTRKRWRRPQASSLVDERPFFVRFSTWLITTIALPNVLHGVMVISRGGEHLDPRAAWLVGVIVSSIHGLFALVDRWRRCR